MFFKLIRFILKPFRSFLRPIFPQWLVNYLYHFPIAFLASHMYGNPMKNLEIIAVTGTDGKTTTSLMIYDILKTAKKKVAVISTVSAKIGRKSVKTGFHVTSPDPWKLQKLLRQIRSKKYRYVVLEVTSHGLDQFRVYPLHPKIAVLTNITHEHLDYHKNFVSYQTAKLKLLRASSHAVVNKDLEIFGSINAHLPNHHFSTFSITNNSQLKPSKVKYYKAHTVFTLGNTEYYLPLTGIYNLYNALSAIAACLIVGVSPADIKRGLANFKGVKGRLEEIPSKTGIHAFVDFAHTPNALSEVLKNLSDKKLKGEKLIVVFGSAGLRDQTKRPLMGEMAGLYADKIIVTSEDPRTEDPLVIANQIKSGIKSPTKPVIELDRGSAIRKAVNLAKRGDWVVVCGKGHEETMCFGENEIPWSDQKELAIALKEKK